MPESYGSDTYSEASGSRLGPPDAGLIKRYSWIPYFSQIFAFSTTY